jgi:hypothetical protein
MAYILDFCKSDSIGDYDLVSIVGFSSESKIRASVLTKS